MVIHLLQNVAPLGRVFSGCACPSAHSPATTLILKTCQTLFVIAVDNDLTRMDWMEKRYVFFVVVCCFAKYIMCAVCVCLRSTAVWKMPLTTVRGSKLFDAFANKIIGIFTFQHNIFIYSVKKIKTLTFKKIWWIFFPVLYLVLGILANQQKMTNKKNNSWIPLAFVKFELFWNRYIAASLWQVISLSLLATRSSILLQNRFTVWFAVSPIFICAYFSKRKIIFESATISL